MTVKEIHDGKYVSHSENSDNGRDPFLEGYESGHEAARRGELISTTIYKIDKGFRDGYLLGYDCYNSQATRYHRRDSGEDNEG